jgi:hypothetical protein
VKLDEEMIFPHTDERGAILSQATALDHAFASGQRLVTSLTAASA